MSAETDAAKLESVPVERRRPYGAGGVREVRAGVWLVDVELPRDPETRKRRRVSRTIVGTREDVDLELAQLKVTASQRRAPSGPLRARSVQAALEGYVKDARAGRIELAPKTIVTTTSVRTMSKQMLSDGRRFGDIRLARLSWQEIEEMYASMK